jgi:hypothetical protein
MKKHSQLVQTLKEQAGDEQYSDVNGSIPIPKNETSQVSQSCNTSKNMKARTLKKNLDEHQPTTLDADSQRLRDPG